MSWCSWFVTFVHIYLILNQLSFCFYLCINLKFNYLCIYGQVLASFYKLFVLGYHTKIEIYFLQNLLVSVGGVGVPSISGGVGIPSISG